MSRTVIVRYRTRPEAAEENARLIEAVFAALDDVKPDGFWYRTFRLADGVSFVHVARHEGTDNPLSHVAAFAEFQRDLADRCVEQPTPSEATLVGSYGIR